MFTVQSPLVRFAGWGDPRRAPEEEQSLEQAEAAYRQGIKYLDDQYWHLAKDSFQKAAYCVPYANSQELAKYENAQGVALARRAPGYSNYYQTMLQDFNRPGSGRKLRDPSTEPYHFARFVMSRTETAKEELRSFADAYRQFRRAQDVNYHSPEQLDPAHFLNSANLLYELARFAPRVANLQLAAAARLLRAQGETDPRLEILRRKADIADRAEAQYAALTGRGQVFNYVA